MIARQPAQQHPKAVRSVKRSANENAPRHRRQRKGQAPLHETPMHMQVRVALRRAARQQPSAITPDTHLCTSADPGHWQRSTLVQRASGPAGVLRRSCACILLVRGDHAREPGSWLVFRPPFPAVRTTCSTPVHSTAVLCTSTPAVELLAVIYRRAARTHGRLPRLPPGRAEERSRASSGLHD